ncbi:hypothetical protein CFIO01_08522 [Colletotrichum fioriniae PJ7]|uniref:Uncharacterized protein n=1 Tax=Colletotrichum fioriniae PJ7 TaxID=1445577 RepID=A0A010QUH6_9PEZI|nr:hypothetical protein CFIO01_08522 [Colletotrichum fioriniae PJ7]
MQANGEPSQAMSPDAHLQQRVPVVSSNQCSPESASEVNRYASPRPKTPPTTSHPTSATETHEPTMFNPEAEITASETSPNSPQAICSINPDSFQHEDLSVLSTGIRRNPTSVTTCTSAQQTPGGPEESQQLMTASAERLDETKRASETLKPTWKVWALEISCIAISTLLLAVIIVVLLKYDSQVQPNWPLNATLNSFLALFTTLAKAAFMVPVCACISQSQWAWFNTNGVSRPLYDFEVIDQASRGAWGSLILLWRFRFRHFVVLGALLTAMSALTSPVTQLSITYSLKNVTVAREATESQATTLAVRDLMYPRDSFESAIRFAGYQTTFLDYENFEKPLPYAAIDTNATFCSTGNCTFDRYHSLGICVEIANITPSLKVAKLENGRMTETQVLHKADRMFPNSSVWKLSLPGGFEFDHQSRAALYTDILNGNHTFAFQHSPALLRARIASFFLMYTAPVLTESDKTWWGSRDQSQDITWVEVSDHVHGVEHEAVEVLFHLCVQSYTTTVQLGKERTIIEDAFTEPVGKDDQAFLDVKCLSLVQNGSYACKSRPNRWNEVLSLKSPTRSGSLSVKPFRDEAEDFSASYRAMEAISQFMRSYFTGIAYLDMSPAANGFLPLETKGSEFLTTLHISGLFSQPNIPNPERRKLCLENVYKNAATLLSASLRMNRPYDRWTKGVFNVPGQATIMATYVNITWPWVMLLAAEIAAAAVFLVITIVYYTGGTDSKYRDLKSSSLGTLVALSPDCRFAAGGGLQPVDALQELAKGVQVQLIGSRIVVAEDQTDETPSRETTYGVSGVVEDVPREMDRTQG